MKDQHILVLVGISGSGKTQLAMHKCHDENYVRVNRDDIREMLFGYTPDSVHEYYEKPGIQFREKLVSNIQDKMIREILKDKKNPVIDNTNLKWKYIKEFKKYGLPVRIGVVEVDLDLAISRDRTRDRTVGEKIIRQQFENFAKLKSLPEFGSLIKK